MPNTKDCPDATKISFEEYFAGSSRVERAIEYDYSEDGAEVCFRDGECFVKFPIYRIGWMIKCLKKIEKESGI